MNENTLKDRVISLLMDADITVQGYTQYNNLSKNMVEGIIEYSFPVNFTNVTDEPPELFICGRAESLI
jgi:hypothetical protein